MHTSGIGQVGTLIDNSSARSENQGKVVQQPSFFTSPLRHYHWYLMIAEWVAFLSHVEELKHVEVSFTIYLWLNQRAQQALVLNKTSILIDLGRPWSGRSGSI